MKNEISSRSRTYCLLAGGALLVVVIALWFSWLSAKPHRTEPVAGTESPSEAAANSRERDSPLVRRVARRLFGIGGGSRAEAGTNAQQIVANKLRQFAQNRRQVLHDMARHFKVSVPEAVERFFEAVESGNWDVIEAQFKSLDTLRKTEPRPPDLIPLWSVILETFGVAEITHRWPAQKLLDYGNAILDSLRPGMVYIGGTDPGRFIPTFLNETSEGERHVVLTQNAFADKTYLDYVRFLYGDRMPMPTAEDSQRAFSEFVSDARKRFEHDREFPNEPKQIRPGEDVRVDGGNVQVSGQIAVMGINEKIFQTLMKKNPDLSFAIEESFPLKSTYANASPLGLIMELGVQDEQRGLTAERAAQSIEYWRSTAQQLLADPEASVSPEALKTYSKMAAAQGNLFADRKFSAEAEQAYRIASELWPASPEATFEYVNLLVGQKRMEEAAHVVGAALKAAPENIQFRSLAEQIESMKEN